MKKLFLILFLFCVAYITQAQNNVPKFLRSYAINATDAAFDNLGNLYLITAAGQLKKYSPEGDSVAIYNSIVRNGKLAAIDVSNPLKPLLFYKNFSQVVILDRLLSLRGMINLRRSGILQPAAVGLSYDNMIWVFDAGSNTLIKIDESGAVLLQTTDLRTVFAGGLQPQQIIDAGGWVYLYDAAQGLYAFDYFGTFKRKIPVAGWSGITITPKTIFGFAKGVLNNYNLSTLMQKEQAVPQKPAGCAQLRLGPQRLAAICNEEVRLFSWTY